MLPRGIKRLSAAGVARNSRCQALWTSLRSEVANRVGVARLCCAGWASLFVLGGLSTGARVLREIDGALSRPRCPIADAEP